MSSSPSRFQLRGGRPPKISCPSAASIGSQHTMAELVQCSLINCWSHVQNATRGPWPSMQASGDGRRKRPWSDLPAPNAVIRKKSVLAALTPREKAHSNTKLQVAVSSAYCSRVRPKTSGVARELSWISNLDCAITQVSAPARLSSSCRPTGRANAPPMTISAKQSSVGLAKRICFLATLVALTAEC